MRLTVLLVAAAAGLSLAAPAQGPGRAQPDVLKLAAEHKLGPVTFSHTNHTTKNYNMEGTGPVTCVECHHTEQPAAELAKRPSLKTAYPADRTTTLTADLLKSADAPAVTVCRDCHARAAAKPKLLPEVPQIKHEGSTATITLTNQQAYHRNCAGCHDEAAKQRPGVKAPTTTRCVACHNRK